LEMVGSFAYPRVCFKVGGHIPVVPLPDDDDDDDDDVLGKKTPPIFLFLLVTNAQQKFLLFFVKDVNDDDDDIELLLLLLLIARSFSFPGLKVAFTEEEMREEKTIDDIPLSVKTSLRFF